MSALLANAYLHSLDPIILPISGDFAVRWYGLSYIAGFLLGWLIVWGMAKSHRSIIPAERVSDLVFAVIIGVLVGGRLGYVLFYQPSLLIDFSGDFPFWGVLALNKGGMASHGGIIGVVLAGWWFSRRVRVPALHTMDVAAIACTPGLFLGRIANFVNAELWGRPLPETMQAAPPWWSVKYPQEVYRWSTEQLAALREVVSEVGVSSRSWEQAVAIAERPDPPKEAMEFLERGQREIVQALQAGNELVIEAVPPMLTAYYPSQIFQAIADGPVLLFILAMIWLKPRQPGVVSGGFLIGYGVLRILTELFRQPDEGVALSFGLLSRGQTLSALMIVVGAAIVGWSVRQKRPRIGGLIEPVRPAPAAADESDRNRS